MPERLTDARIDELLALEAKATPGDWSFSLKPECLIEPHVQVYTRNGVAYTICTPVHSNEETANNMRLIAASRNSIRSLLEEVRERRAAESEAIRALKAIRQKIENSEQWWMDCPDRGGFDTDEIDAAIARAEKEGKSR